VPCYRHGRLWTTLDTSIPEEEVVSSWEEITRGMEFCDQRVYWWAGGRASTKGECEREPQHEGNHYDGMSWFNDSHEPDEPDPNYDVSAGPNARWRRTLGW